MASTLTDEPRSEMMRSLFGLIGSSERSSHYADNVHYLQLFEDGDEPMDLESEDDDEPDEHLLSRGHGHLPVKPETSLKVNFPLAELHSQDVEKPDAPLPVRPHFDLHNTFTRSDIGRLSSSGPLEPRVEGANKDPEGLAILSEDEDGGHSDNRPLDHDQPVTFNIKLFLESRYTAYGLHAPEDENFGDILLTSSDRASLSKFSYLHNLEGLSDTATSESPVEGKGKGRETPLVPTIDSAAALLKKAQVRLESLRAQRQALDTLTSDIMRNLLECSSKGDSDMDEDYYTALSHADMDEDVPDLEQASTLYPIRRFMEPEFVEGPSSFTLDDLRKQNESWY